MQRIDVLRDRRGLLRQIGLRGREHLFGLAQVGARRDTALQPGAGQGHAALRTGGGIARDGQQALVRAIVQPRLGDVADQRQPGGARRRLGREIAVERRAGQRSDAAEQVEFEGVDAQIDRPSAAAAIGTRNDAASAAIINAAIADTAIADAPVSGAAITRAGPAIADTRATAADGVGGRAPRSPVGIAVAAIGADIRQQAGALDAILRTGRGDVRSGHAQVAVVDQRLFDQPLQPGIAENVGVADGRQRRL